MRVGRGWSGVCTGRVGFAARFAAMRLELVPMVEGKIQTGGEVVVLAAGIEGAIDSVCVAGWSSS